MTTDEFDKVVRDWIATARHPKTRRRYTEMVYQPMLELLRFLRANAFKTFIVSGGGIEFMRPWTENVYGIPPEQVVGSSGKLKFELRDGKPVLVKMPGLDFIDDKAGKPVGIQQHIGRRRSLPSATQTAICRCCSGRGRRRRALHGNRAPHRRRARMGLRPQIARRRARQGPGRSTGQSLDRRRHEERLEDRFPLGKK